MQYVWHQLSTKVYFKPQILINPFYKLGLCTYIFWNLNTLSRRDFKYRKKKRAAIFVHKKQQKSCSCLLILGRDTVHLFFVTRPEIAGCCRYIWPFTLSTDFLCLLSITGPLHRLSSGYFEKLRAFCTQRTHFGPLPAISRVLTYINVHRPNSDALIFSTACPNFRGGKGKRYWYCICTAYYSLTLWLIVQLWNATFRIHCCLGVFIAVQKGVVEYIIRQLRFFIAVQKWVVEYIIRQLRFFIAVQKWVIEYIIRQLRFFIAAYTVKNAVELLGASRPDVEKIQYHWWNLFVVLPCVFSSTLLTSKKVRH